MASWSRRPQVCKSIVPDWTGFLVPELLDCNCELIWGGYRDIEEEEGGDFFMVTNLSCPKCDAHVEVYAAKED